MTKEFSPDFQKITDGSNMDKNHRVKDWVYGQFLDAVERWTDLQDQNEYIDEFYFLRQNKIPVVIFNHLSHADFGPILKVAGNLNKIGNPKVNASLILAKSLATGDQSGMLGDFYRAAEPKLIKSRVSPIYVTREKDREKYKLPMDSTELRKVIGVVRRGDVLIYCPEGTVEGGRTNPETGELNGLVRVADQTLPTILGKEALKKELAFLPVAIQGTNEIYNPTTEKVTTDIKRDFALQLLHHHPSKIATATVGKPFTSVDMINDGVDIGNPEEFNTYLMSNIAQNLPEELRGYYR